MKKFIITLKEESELLESIITLLESNGIIEVEEVQTKKQNHHTVKVIAIDEETREEIEFDSIQQASDFADTNPTRLAKQLDTKEPFKGYYWYKVRESKYSKLKI